MSTLVLQNNFLTSEDIMNIDAATSFKDLTPIGLGILRRMYERHAGIEEIGMVCGPISPRGGLGCRHKNIQRFALVIQILEEQGHVIYNQLIFEEKMFELVSAGQPERRLLEDFYLPLFETGLIARKFFQDNWETSRGTCWELEQSRKLGIPAHLLSPPPECKVCGIL